jgi:hypothetical protein
LAEETSRRSAEVDEQLTTFVSATRGDFGQLQRALGEMRALVEVLVDDIPALRWRLAAFREDPSYEARFAEQEPLVSVRIATYNRVETLIDRAIRSVFEQTYERFEIVVVGDHTSVETEDALRRLNDRRVRYLNLPIRGPYPSDDAKRWMVAGSPAMNAGAHLARGTWIAPLDDDDEFLPTHIEVLLGAAVEQHCEMAYGLIEQVGPPPHDVVLGRYPPEPFNFGFQAAVHLRGLNFFDYDPRCWLLNETGDWNLCRRMLEAGVRIGFVAEPVTRYYPSVLHPPPQRAGG